MKSFYDAINNNIHLQGDLHCIEAEDDYTLDLPLGDYEGDNRIIGDHVDIGPDEYLANFADSGDVNVNLLDAIISLQMLASMEISMDIFLEADLNGDRKIGLEDRSNSCSANSFRIILVIKDC